MAQLRRRSLPNGSSDAGILHDFGRVDVGGPELKTRSTELDLKWEIEDPSCAVGIQAVQQR
jgi:hypothetical protein